MAVFIKDNLLYTKLANDLGNGDTKININDVEYINASTMADITDRITDGERFGSDTELAEYMENFVLDIKSQVFSTAISPARNGRVYLIGDTALDIPALVETASVGDFKDKSKADMPLIITLTNIASEAIYTEYLRTRTLPKSLEVVVDMTVALPILESRKKGNVEAYEARYLDNEHRVVCRNFKEDIEVIIEFNEVLVMFEGEAAQHKIRHAKGGLLQNIQNELNAHYPELVADGVTAEMIVKQSTVMGIDIGDVTTDFPHFKNGKLSEISSDSVNLGYGLALEEAVKKLNSDGIKVSTRSQIVDIIEKKDEPIHRKLAIKAEKALDLELSKLSRNIVSEITRVLSGSALTSLGAVFLYGGGVVKLEPILRKELQEVVAHLLGEDSSLPFIFIDEEYAQRLNELGLKLVLDIVASDTVIEGVAVNG